MRRSGIRKECAMADMNMTSLAVWDVPMPAVAGEKFSIKVGAKSAAGRALAGGRVEVSDASGAVVASGRLGETLWPETEALYWAELNMPAPVKQQVAEFTVRFVPDRDHQAATSRFSVVVAVKPEHTLIVNVAEQTTKAALEGVEIRLGPFHARTDKSGRAELRVSKGAYQLQLWRNAHIAAPQPISIDGNVNVELTMAHVPEEHPDARWVR
jgi:hypothetical protein